MTILPELRARVPSSPDSATAATPDDADILWYHPGFCQFSLPATAGAAIAWQRTMGGTSISIDPGSDRDRLPGGPLLRRLLMHLCDTALRTGQPQVVLGANAEALAASMNPPVPATASTALETQVASVLACRIVLATEGGPGLSVLDARGRPRAVAPEWRPAMRLNGRFLDNLSREKVALDRQVLARLQESTLALDTYAWLAATLPAQVGQTVLAESWPELQARFGEQDQDSEAFQAAYTAALALLRSALPGLDVDDDAIGVGFSARAPAAAAPTPEPEPQPDLPAEPVRPRQRAPEPPTPSAPAPVAAAMEIERAPQPEPAQPPAPPPEPTRHQPAHQEPPRYEQRRPDQPRPDQLRPEQPRPEQPRPEHPRFEPREPPVPGQPMRQTISLKSHITGLQQVVWLQRAQGRDNVLIEVTPGSRYDPNLVTVLALEPIVLQIAGGLHARDFERVSTWATANRDLIDAFWDSEIDSFDEIISRVRKVPVTGFDRGRA